MSRLCTRLLPVALITGMCVTSTQAMAQTSPPQPPSQQLGSYYVALGDSLGYGLTTPGIPADPTCVSPASPGYVCIVYGYLKQINPSLQLVNLSEPDVDSCVLIHGYGNGSPCINPPGSGTTASPLQAAVKLIHDHPGQVGPITINIGGADLIPLLPNALKDPLGTAAKLPGVFTAFSANLDETLATLRAAAGPNGEIILVNQYNPLGGISAPPLPAGLPDLASSAIKNLNSVMASTATKYNVRVADVAGTFDAQPGGAALLTFVPTSLASGDPSKIDIYPLREGYRVLATKVLQTSGYTVSVKGKIRLSHKSLRRGATQKVRGTAPVSSSVTVTVTLPRVRPRTVNLIADNTGSYALSVSAGKHVGKAKVRACALDLVTRIKKCVKTTFTIR